MKDDIRDQYEELEACIDSAKQQVRTDGYAMSIGEVGNMYKDGELIIHPEYQRYFRWDNEQQSKLIESILIGLPLPTFFMAQTEEGFFEVVDGLQRLSTIFSFMGILKKEDEQMKTSFKDRPLSDQLFYLKKLSEKKWSDLSSRIQLDFKRSKINIILLLRDTTEDSKFELFQRLNTGGTHLSGQELRNAILSASDHKSGGKGLKMLTWLESMAECEEFNAVAKISDAQKNSRYDMELVLRFAIFLEMQKNEEEYNAFRRLNSLEVYLTHKMREMIESASRFSTDECGNIFKKTFRILHTVFGDRALHAESNGKKKKFSISLFEAIALGVAQNINDYNVGESGDIEETTKELLKKKKEKAQQSSDFIRYSRSGANTKQRIKSLLKLGMDEFKYMEQN